MKSNAFLYMNFSSSPHLHLSSPNSLSSCRASQGMATKASRGMATKQACKALPQRAAPQHWPAPRTADHNAQAGWHREIHCAIDCAIEKTEGLLKHLAENEELEQKLQGARTTEKKANWKVHFVTTPRGPLIR